MNEANSQCVPIDRYVLSALVVVVILMSLLRYLKLDADFPLGVTWSGVLYTDEGWYTNAAVRHRLTGNWYLPGDFNPVINMPVGQLLHRAVFSLFGLGIESARITTATSFILLTVLITLLAYYSLGWSPAILTSLLMATNFFGFVYSRLAVVEFMATLFVAGALVTVAVPAREKAAVLTVVASSVLLAVGVLTKTTAVFGVPLVAYLIYRREQSWRRRAYSILAFGCSLAVIVGGYHYLMMQSFPDDYRFFTSLNMTGRLYEDPISWLTGNIRMLWQTRRIGIGLLTVSGILSILALLVSKRYRESTLTHVFIGYIVCYIGVLSLVAYSPPRYYLPLVAPVAALGATAATELMAWLRNSSWPARTAVSYLPLILLLTITAEDSQDIVSYIRHPDYSFTHMAQSVGSVIEEREGKLTDVTMIGNMADSVALEIGVRSVNANIGTEELEWKLKRYRPTYLIAPQAETAVLETIEDEGGDTDKIGSWDVYANYYTGTPVCLYHIEWETVGIP